MTAKKTATPAADVPAITGEVTDEAVPAKNVTPGAEPEAALVPATADPKRLKAISKAINAEYGKGVEAQFAIGALLAEARNLHPSDKLFGQWFNEQSFPFGTSPAYYLRVGSERESEVRALLASGEVSSEWGVTSAVKYLTRQEGDDRQPAARVKAVQDLVGPEPETNAFVKFRTAAEAIDVSQLATEELVEFAGIVKGLAAAYSAERTSRQARTREV